MSVRAPEIVFVVFQILQLHLIEFAWRRATEPMEQFQRSKPRPSGTSGRLNQRLKVFERSQILFESMSGYICHMMTNTHSIPPFLHTPLSLFLCPSLSRLSAAVAGEIVAKLESITDWTNHQCTAPEPQEHVNQSTAYKNTDYQSQGATSQYISCSSNEYSCILHLR